MPIHAHILWGILTCKVGYIDLAFGVQAGFISRSAQITVISVISFIEFLPPSNAAVVMRYVCLLCAVATICATLVNIHTYRETQTDSILTSL